MRGVSRPAISNIENGNTSGIDFDVLEKLAMLSVSRRAAHCARAEGKAVTRLDLMLQIAESALGLEFRAQHLCG
jgi:transcriptional regulator with XRE-family HTH domain